MNKKTYSKIFKLIIILSALMAIFWEIKAGSFSGMKNVFVLINIIAECIAYAIDTII